MLRDRVEGDKDVRGNSENDLKIPLTMMTS
jgi:hypothetical protein